MVGRRTITSLVLLVAAGVSGAAAQTQSVAALRQAVAQSDGRVIVILKSNRAGASMRAAGSPPISDDEMTSIKGRLKTGYSLEVADQVPMIGALVGTISDAQIARLAADTNVASIEPDVKTYLMASTASEKARPARVRADAIPWGVTDVGAPAAWAAGYTGTGTKVGIIDTGIDINHPDLGVAGGYDFTTSSSAPAAYNDTFASCDGHGTHVAGTVAARQNGVGVVGIAPDASLYALKVFTDLGTGCFAYTSAQMMAIQWAATNHLDVVNISIANGNSPSWQAIISAANALGVVVVCAAGNSGAPGITFPAAVPGAVAVAALNGDNSVAGFSSSGPEMWVAAPGSGITSTLPGGGYGDKSGTSMAAPHVTGVVALIRSMHPTWTADQVRNELKARATDLSTAGFDNSTGWGLVQVPPSGVAPLSMAVSPAARSVSVVQGASAPGDNATVTLSGTNASTTPWSATKRKTWLTFTNSSGTGSGTASWTRNATGLAVGTYVDTITVSATGVSGSATVYDTLKITAPVVPVSMAVSPAARSVSVVQGASAPGDNATVTLSGTNASTTPWAATKRKSWLTFTNASGTGSGTASWTRNATGLAVGTYVDTITVSATGVSGSATVYDTLKITAPVVPVTMAVSPAARSVSVVQGASAPGDNATVTLSGTNASTTPWSATKRKSWLTFTNASGTGSGTASWTRNATGLAVGTYVDTITVSATGVSGSATVYDTLKITAPVVPVTMAVSPAARSVSVVQGASAPGDNATVTLSGTNASTTPWSATKRKSWLTFTNASGTGSGTASWTRNATGLAVGTYVDTITVSATGVSGSATVFDTLTITAAIVPVSMAVAPAARSVSVVQGGAAPSDNASITLSGTNASTTAWSATKRKTWLTFTNASGTGSGTASWTRNATGLAVGTYVDTITVTATGVSGSATVYDTLKITAAIVPVTMAVSPAARSVSVQQGSAAPGDNASITLSGTNASTTAWSATKRKTWLTFINASGTGSGTVSWTRNATGLAAGVYVDTITVSAAGVSPATVYDTLRITVAPVPLVLAVSPGGLSIAAQEGAVPSGDHFNVTLTGTGAASTAWSATKRHSWVILNTASGTGNGAVVFGRSSAGLTPGIYVDTITVTATGAVGSPAIVYDTLKITAMIVPVTVAVSPAARTLSVQAGGVATGDNAAVTLAGTNASSTAWSAARRQPWLTLTNASGTGSGTVTWNRNATGLAVGTYVDTITVSVSGATPAVLYDTLKITSAPVPIALAVSPGSRSVSVQQGNAAPGDNAAVVLTGTNASSIVWSAAKRKAWITLTAASGTGTGTVTWNRNAAGLAVGTYVDTITVSAGGAIGSPAMIFDTLRITAPIVPVSIAVNPGGRSATVQQGNAATSSNAAVTVSGTNASSTVWSAINRRDWLTLTNAGGSGSGTLSWNRNAIGLAVGTYIDTITVNAAGVPSAVVYDTLTISPAPVPVVLSANPGGFSTTAQQGSVPPSGSFAVTLTGTDAAATAWSATHRRASVLMTNANGIGSGHVTFARSAAGLGVGVYVDTIVVTASGVTGSATVYDTLRITAAPQTFAIYPRGGKVRALQFPGPYKLSGPDIDSALVQGTLDDTLAAGGWIATVSSSRLQILTASGNVNGYVRWSRAAPPTQAGLYVDTVSVSLVSDPSLRTEYVDSLELVVVAIPTPEVAVGDLFDHRGLDDDQRTALDRQGNTNGHYDLGDLLAWVTRSQIHLSPATALRMKQAALLAQPPATAVKPASGSGGP